MNIDWGALEQRHAFIGAQLAAPALDSSERHKLQKEFSALDTLLSTWRDLSRVERECAELERSSNEVQDEAYRALVAEELDALTVEQTRLRSELDNLLYPPDPLDDRSVFLEIRAGTGGQEAALFAGDLARMYLLYAQHRGWRAAAVNESPTDLGGFREVVLQIEGKGVYGYLKHESGVHRVQRVPSTETSGRIHTSTATVAVLPEAEDVEVTIAPQDVRIDLYRASGAGGQHVNVTDSAVRLTHIPTGLVVACQDERSQHKNKNKAFKILQSRLLALTREKQETERQQQRRDQVGSGERSEKVRTYNYPQNRVTDHQVELTVKNLDMVMEGHLGDIMQALREKDLAERRARHEKQLLVKS